MGEVDYNVVAGVSAVRQMAELGGDGLGGVWNRELGRPGEQCNVVGGRDRVGHEA